MPHFTTDDGVRISYEEAGDGPAIIFAHEFGDNYRSWDPQLGYLARRYRCIAYAARGFPPSDVPDDIARYTQERVAADIGALMDHLKLDRAHLVGVSMGSYAVLNFALTNADRVLSLAIGSGGHGSDLDRREQVLAAIEARAQAFIDNGAAKMAEMLADDAVRRPFRVKDPLGWEAFRERLAGHSALGCAHTLRGVFKGRPSVYAQGDSFKQFDAPVLVMTGDEDGPAIAPSIFMKQHFPRAALVVFPWSGHNLNVEEPAEFNRVLESFFHAVELGRWGGAKAG